MPLNPTTTPDRESLIAIDEALAGMMSRLKAILSKPPLTQDALVEITSIYNNVAYIFLYLEANEEYVDYHRLLPWRDAFHKNTELDEQILALLLDVRCPDPEADESRLAYIAELQQKLRGLDQADAEELDGLLADAKSVLRDIQEDQRDLLERIGVAAGGNPTAVFYRLVSGTKSAATREKLSQAWVKQRDRRRDVLLGSVDRMIEVRRHQTAKAGFDTVLARTLAKCRISEPEVETFLQRYLVQALDNHALLEAEVRQVTGVENNPMEHFGFYLQTVSGGGRTPLFVPDECLDYVFAVAQAVFGLQLQRLPSSNPHVIPVGVWKDGGEVGHINFDLWDTGGKGIGANYTKGLRNRTDWSEFVQHPVAYVSCRFQRGADGSSRITFQNVHSLFHEFGHAVNHLLVRKRLSNKSGLEYLPLERLECFSMWFEKWAYHPSFASFLSLSPEERESVAVSQRLKMIEYRRTYAERAVTALLDFDVHRHSSAGLAASFDRLDERFGISRYCSLGDFPVYFTWPMFVANPGANFSYLWGSSESCQWFAPFQRLKLEEIKLRTDLRELFTPCFDYDAQSDIPNSEAVFKFYATTPSLYEVVGRS